MLGAQEFYEKCGRKTLIQARFVRIVRTFAPFVAGIGQKNLLQFCVMCIVGAVARMVTRVTAGYFFGQCEFVKKHFELVIVAIVVISVLPMAFEFVQARRAAKRGDSALLQAKTIGDSPKIPRVEGEES